VSNDAIEPPTSSDVANDAIYLFGNEIGYVT